MLIEFLSIRIHPYALHYSTLTFAFLFSLVSLYILFLGVGVF